MKVFFFIPIWNIPYSYRIFYMSMEYPKWVWYSYRTFCTHIEYSIWVWNLWGVLVSADCSTGQNLAGKELLKIIWTYAYRIHTDMESSKKFHISMKWSTYMEFIFIWAAALRAVIRFRKSSDLRIWRFTKHQAGTHQLPVKTPVFLLGIWSFFMPSLTCLYIKLQTYESGDFLS